MGRVNDTISNVNSAIRNLLLMIIIAGAGVVGYKGYDLYNAPRQQLADKQAELDKSAAELRMSNDSLKKANDEIELEQKQLVELNSKFIDMTAQRDRQQLANRLLKVQHRLARIKVVDQHEITSLNPATPSGAAKNAASKVNVLTKIQFMEINEQGEPLGQPKEFEIVGDMIYFDFLRVTFDDKFIELSDLDRSTSIALFQRIFGEHQEPAQGFTLDTIGTRPAGYGGAAGISDFEKKIWDDFWLIANDPGRAADLGIHAAHGDAVSIRVRPGMTYEINLRSTGEISIRPIEPPIVQPLTPTITKN